MVKYFLVVIFALVFSVHSFAQEQITITTYYPSPAGSYNELTVASNLRLETSPTNPAADGPQIEWRTSSTSSDQHWNIDQFQTTGQQPRLRFFTGPNSGAAGTEKVTFLENGNVGIVNKKMGSELFFSGPVLIYADYCWQI